MNCKKCGNLCAVSYSKSVANFGRQFFKCGKDGCTYFQWADTDRMSDGRQQSIFAPGAAPAAAPASSSSSSSSSANTSKGSGGGSSSSINSSSSSSSSSSGSLNKGSSTANGGSKSTTATNTTTANAPTRKVAPGGKKIDVRLALFKIESGPPSRVTFSADFARNDDLSKLCQSFPANLSFFHAPRKMWILDLSIYEQFVSRLLSSEYADLANLPPANEIPRWLIKGLTWYQKKLETVPESMLPLDQVHLRLTPYFREKLLPFQVEGVRFVVRHGGRALIADEMGCGKTVQAIATAVHYQQHWPVLVRLRPFLSLSPSPSLSLSLSLSPSL